MRRIFRVAAGLALLGSVACDHELTVTPLAADSPAALVTVNGAPLPFRMLDSRGDSTSMNGGSLRLKLDGTYALREDRSTPTATGVMGYIMSYDYGTWTARGDSVFLVSTIEPEWGFPATSRGVRTARTITIRAGDKLLHYVQK